MEYKRLEDALLAISKVKFKDEILQELLYKIGHTYFKNNLNKYKEEFYNDAKYYLLIDTITYLQKLTDKIEKEKSDVKKYLELSKIYIEPN